MNKSNEQFEFLDILAILSFSAQIKNMGEDDKNNDYIHRVIEAIAKEIDKLHMENNIIIEQNKEIVKLLREGK